MYDYGFENYKLTFCFLKKKYSINDVAVVLSDLPSVLSCCKLPGQGSMIVSLVYFFLYVSPLKNDFDIDKDWAAHAVLQSLWVSSVEPSKAWTLEIKLWLWKNRLTSLLQFLIIIIASVSEGSSED